MSDQSIKEINNLLKEREKNQEQWRLQQRPVERN